MIYLLGIKEKRLLHLLDLYFQKWEYDTHMKLGTNTAIFILFFGVALAEAFQSRNWLLAGLFLIIGFVFLYADNQKKKS